MYFDTYYILVRWHFGIHIWDRSHLHLHFGGEVYLGGIHLYLHFGYNAYILDDTRAFGGSQLHLHFGCNAHLFWRRYTFKYNCLHMLMKEMTLIRHYCNS